MVNNQLTDIFGMSTSAHERFIRALIVIFLGLLFLCGSPPSLRAQDLYALEAASANGDKEAQNLLALRYYKGDGVPQDNAQAAILFKRAARQGLRKAQFNLAYMYHHGIGLPQDYNMACVWYKAAADQGHSEARKALNRLLQYSSNANLQEIDQLYAETRH